MSPGSEVLLNDSCSDALGEKSRPLLNSKLLLFPFIALLIGLVLDSVRNRFGLRNFQIPSTVFQLFMASIVSWLLYNFLRKTVMLETVMEQYTWINQDPHTLMLLVLPILIFESSFHMNAHAFLNQLGPILTLAVAGFLLTMVLMGGLMFILLRIVLTEVGWTPTTSLAFGAIISATDPVAVVALLSELGVPGLMTILIEGESLLNDGAAIVCFKLLEFFMKAEIRPELLDELEHLLIQEIVAVPSSLLIGYLSAKIVTWFLTHAFRDVTKELGILWLAIYGCYAVCELIGGSGVLGLVVFGVTLANCREKINPDTVQEILHLWEFLGYLANCVVFVHSGIVIGEVVAEDKFSVTDAALSLVVYLCSLISRGVVLVLIGAIMRYIQLCRGTPSWSWAQIFMMFWGGLRGAVALLLAVHLRKESHELPDRIKDITLFYTTTTVLLSSLLQAASFQPLINWFKLNRRSVFMRRIIKQRLEKCKDYARERVEEFQLDTKYYFLSSARWETVSRITDNAFRPELEFSSTKEPKPGQLFGAGDIETKTQALDIYLNICKSRVKHMWEEGVFSRRTVRNLLHAFDTALDNREELDVVAITKVAGCLRLPCFAKLVNYVRKKGINKRTHAKSQDWWEVISFAVLLVQFSFCMMLLKTVPPISHQASFLIIFAISMFFTMEQLAMLQRNRKWFAKAPTVNKVAIILDSIFAFYYLGLTVVIGLSLGTSSSVLGPPTEQSYCLLPDADDYNTWKLNDAVCLTAYLMAIIGISVRFSIKLVFFFMLFPKLVAEAIFHKAEMSAVCIISTLNALCRIAEDVKYGLLARALPEQQLLYASSRYNRNLKRRAERELVNLLKSDRNLEVYRFVETRQTTRMLLVDVQKLVDDLEYEGLLTGEEVAELEGRIESALGDQHTLTVADTAVPDDVAKQLRRISWLRDRRINATPDSVIGFLMEPGRLIRFRGPHNAPVVPEGFVFFRQGDPPDGVYFLNDGFCQFERPLEPLKYIYPGNWFGERALLTGRGRPNDGRYGTVTAATTCIVYFLDLNSVKDFLNCFPAIRQQLVYDIDIEKCKDLLRIYRPYHSWTDAQLEEYIGADHLFTVTEGPETHIVQPHQCVVVLQGAVRQQQLEAVWTFVEPTAPSGDNIRHGKDGMYVDIKPYSLSEPAYVLKVEDLRLEDLAPKSQVTSFAASPDDVTAALARI